jgi:rubrerythrin
MSKFKDYMIESRKPKALNELFIKLGELSNSKKGKERDVAIARLAMIAELDAVNLYEQMIQYVTDADLKTILQDIANEEKVHSGEFEYILSDLDPQWEEFEDEGEEEAEEKTTK